MKIAHSQSVLFVSCALALAAAWLPAPQGRHAHRECCLSPEQARVLRAMKIGDLPDGQGGVVRTLRITGVNVQIVNGLGATNGYPIDPDSIDPLLTVTNGTGNLIVGYNELGNPQGDDRTGSHNIVVGNGHTYTSFGGIVGSRYNTSSGAYASVTGGLFNRATGDYSSVTAGRQNRAEGLVSSISGGGTFFGIGNIASGILSSVSGGCCNEASGQVSSVSGGQFNVASGDGATICGGEDNQCTGQGATVLGGAFNVADGRFSSVGGGEGRVVSTANTSGDTDHDWIAGSLWEDD